MTTRYSNFAKKYDEAMGENGDAAHQYTIDPALLELIGSVEHKTIYDIGCGNGYLARKLASEGAKVYASDITQELIQIAKEKTPSNQDISYSCCDACDVTNIPNQYIDIAYANMVIHYIENIDNFAKALFRILKNNGTFIFTMDHMLRQLAVNDLKLKDHSKAEIIIGKHDYLEIKSEEIAPKWDDSQRLTVYRRPLSHYINTFANNGLYTTQILEPKTQTLDSKNQLASSDIPMFIAIKLAKLRQT